ncbi:hypothetical protein FEM48_Zijuj09G0023100 [Ziziphus jujuba var. spinosa]|uniref:Beta-glucosidase 11-like n=1 Tax=Ziziphus jujuba var. spinosa TaxID=714518 RepID=A0A978UQB9_ZIZJJ|nr:hypothetical protein FEM48_Zijuj09G0023100 [Ziziphus jujuba var. spinosa]
MWNLSLLQILVITLLAAIGVCNGTNKYSRDDFPPTFVFGSGTSAYQVEGAANEDGRTPSIWDTFAHAGLRYARGATGDVACDQYHKYKEDVQLMADIGLEAYRFSISWSRLIPNGRGPVNPEGLRYYNNLINELVDHGIQPHVALFNYDLPQALEDEYGGWISRKVVKDFIVYADVCFREFGDRVQYWSTVNEPNVLAQGGYDTGIVPPQRCSPPFGRLNCTRGNSTTEPYIAVHHILLAHASTEKQHGFIGLCIYALWYKPFTDSKEDIIATRRAYDFLYGWVLDPLVFGDYPQIMKENAGSRIPAFTKAESKIVKGSFDFIGIIHYLTASIKDNSRSLAEEHRDYTADAAVTIAGNFSLTDFEVAISDSYYSMGSGRSAGLFETSLWKSTSQRNQRNSSLEDTPRVEYMKAYIGGLLNALRNGSNTRGYFTWSFLDVFELLDGYESGYGLYYVDLDDPNLKRYPKLSSHWYSNFLKGKSAGSEGLNEFDRNPETVSFD